MHEREPSSNEDRLWVFTDCVKAVDDAGHRAAWMETAEMIADNEQGRAFYFNDPLSRTNRSYKHDDRVEPRFLYVGDRQSLTFMAETAAGIIRHGEAFACWVREIGGSPGSPEEFEKAFLGHWKSAEEFAQHVLDERAAKDSERSDGEEPREDLPVDAESWARDLERRGEIRVVPSPLGGVWIFRGW